MTIMPAGVIVGWPSSLPVPAGWEAFSAANGRYIELSAGAAPGPGGGSHSHSVMCTHTHSHAAVLNTPTAAGHLSYSFVPDQSSQIRFPTHPHTHELSASGPVLFLDVATEFSSASSSIQLEPMYYTLRLIRSLGTAPIPVNAFVFGLSSSAPAGYTTVSTPSYYVLASTTTGTTGGSGTQHSHTGAIDHSFPSHSHTASGVSIQQSSLSTRIKGGSIAVSTPGESHTHSGVVVSSTTHSGSSSAYSLSVSEPELPFYSVALWQKTSVLEYEPKGICVLANTTLPSTVWERVSDADGRLLRFGTPGMAGGEWEHTHSIAAGQPHSCTISSSSQYHPVSTGYVGWGETVYVEYAGDTTSVNPDFHLHDISYSQSTWQTYVSASTSMAVGASAIPVATYRLRLYEYKQDVRRSTAIGSGWSYSTANGKGALRDVTASALASSVGEAVLANFTFARVEALAESISAAHGSGVYTLPNGAVALASSVGRAKRQREAPRRSTTRRL